MSDYIDENFEEDETGEYWGMQRWSPEEHVLKAHEMDIRKITVKCQPKKIEMR